MAIAPHKTHHGLAASPVTGGSPHCAAHATCHLRRAGSHLGPGGLIALRTRVQWLPTGLPHPRRRPRLDAVDGAVPEQPLFGRPLASGARGCGRRRGAPEWKLLLRTTTRSAASSTALLRFASVNHVHAIDVWIGERRIAAIRCRPSPLRATSYMYNRIVLLELETSVAVGAGPRPVPPFRTFRNNVPAWTVQNVPG